MYAISIKQLDLLAVAGSYENRKGWVHNGRKLNTNLFVCIEEGNCSFKINNTLYYLEKNDFIIIPRNTFYKPCTSNYCRHWFGHFYGDYLGESKRLDTKKEISSQNVLYLPKVGKADNVLLSYLNKISNEINDINPNSNFVKNLAFLNALNYVSKNIVPNAENLSAQKIKQYIMENLNKDITLSRISKHFGYSKQYVIQVFKKHFFITPTKFIIDQRLEISKIYLAETTLKVYEIAIKCGFEDANYFSRLFRNNYNLSPQKYRDEIIASNKK